MLIIMWLKIERWQILKMKYGKWKVNSFVAILELTVHTVKLIDVLVETHIKSRDVDFCDGKIENFRYRY